MMCRGPGPPGSGHSSSGSLTLSTAAAKTPEAVRMSLTLSAAKTSNPAAVRKSLSLKGSLKGEGASCRILQAPFPLP